MEPVMDKVVKESEVEVVSDGRMESDEDVAVTVPKLAAADWTSTSAQRHVSAAMSIKGLQLVPADCNVDLASSSEPSNGHDVPDAAELIDKTSDAMASTHNMRSLEKSQVERGVEDSGIGHNADKDLLEEADSASCSGAIVFDRADSCVAANAGQNIVIVDLSDCTSFCAQPSFPLNVLATHNFAPLKPAAPHGPRRRRKARQCGHAYDDDDSDNDIAGFALHLPEKPGTGSSSRRKCRRLCDENTPPQTQPRR